MPTIAEMKAQKASGKSSRIARRTDTVTLTTGQHLADEWKQFENERLDAAARLGRLEDEKLEIRADLGDNDGEPTGPPRKSSQGVPPRLAEIDSEIRALNARFDEIEAEKAALNERMAEHQGELTIQSTELGEWLRWCGEHPAREDNKIDEELTGGQCNAEDLLDALGTYAAAWDGDPLNEGDWDSIDLVPGDFAETVRRVVDLHGQRFNRVPKSQKPSSTTESGESA